MIYDKESINLMMAKSLSVMLIFNIYWLLNNYYKGIFTSASPMAGHCQHTCKYFAFSIQLYCSTAYKTQHWRCMPRKTSFYCTLLFMACHFEGVIITFCIMLCNKTGSKIEWLCIKTIPTNCPFKYMLYRINFFIVIHLKLKIYMYQSS